MNTEPVAVGAGVVAVVTAVLGVLAAFGIDITNDQSHAILALTAALVLLVGAVAAIVRAKVVPVAKLPAPPLPPVD
jgi:membrane protein DedA with SNARE-associated domain